MASLIPALSEKAKQEITKNINYHPILGTSSTPVWDIIEAFQDLFDLEKYPITWERLSEYLSKSTHYERAEAGSNVFFRCLYQKYKSITKTTDIAWVLKQLMKLTGKRDIDIIGDIHGWWEKPQTY